MSYIQSNSPVNIDLETLRSVYVDVLSHGLLHTSTVEYSFTKQYTLYSIKRESIGLTLAFLMYKAFCGDPSCHRYYQDKSTISICKRQNVHLPAPCKMSDVCLPEENSLPTWSRRGISKKKGTLPFHSRNYKHLSLTSHDFYANLDFLRSGAEYYVVGGCTT